MNRLIATMAATGLILAGLAYLTYREVIHKQQVATHVAKVAAAKKVRSAQQVLNSELIAAQITACLRGNILRGTVNTDTLVIKQFMLIAADAYAKVGTPFAVKRAASYRTGAERLKLVPEPNCEKVIFKP